VDTSDGKITSAPTLALKKKKAGWGMTALKGEKKNKGAVG